MSFRQDWAVAAVCIGAAVGLAALVAPARSDAESGAPVGAIRRLTQDQYRQTIADIFGTDIKITGRFEPDRRREGLLAVGASAVTVTPAGAEQYDLMARGIAAQVVDPQHRDTTIPCKPRDPEKADRDCAEQFLKQAGRLLYRRPLTNEELKSQVRIADDVADQSKNFYGGVESSLSGMLVSPQFLFTLERGRRDPTHPGVSTLDGYSKAQRLSFLLWNSAPDGPLLAAAERGDLDMAEGLAKQTDRLMNSPRFERGVRAFFSDMFGFSAFENLSKDATIYPKFSPAVALDAREQTLRLLVDHLARRDADYRDLFTTRKTFMNRRLGAIYRVPVVSRSSWEPYEFAADDSRAGLLGQLSFLTLYSHPGRSSPTLRGKAIRETLLCQEVPAPPANVDFALVQDTANPQFRTARARLARHNTEPMCAGCHRLTDPLGLPLENFDSSGEYRATENQAAIDASGEHNGVKFTGAAGLGEVLKADEQATSCLVHRLYAYGVGRPLSPADDRAIAPLEQGFKADGAYRKLIRTIATSDVFYAMPPRAATQVALGSPTSRKR
ncbi:MAG: hypothetical protein JWQ29_2957 [Phenylobacterium sp.]|nr:hypothetical protein [Phenylobacterium sp.]